MADLSLRLEALQERLERELPPKAQGSWSYLPFEMRFRVELRYGSRGASLEIDCADLDLPGAEDSVYRLIATAVKELMENQVSYLTVEGGVE